MLTEGTTGIFRPLLRHGQLLAANVMANVCEGKIYQRLINLSDNEMKIPRNTRLAEFTALSASDVLISMDEPDSPDSNNKTLSNGTSKVTLAAATINNSTSKISDQVHIGHDVLTPDQVKVVQQLVDEFSDIFRPHLRKCSIVEHRIDLLPDQRPFRRKPYKLPMQQEIMDKIIQNLKEQDVVRESTSPFSNPAFLVLKKGHKQGSLDSSAYRLVIDYRGLNRICISDSYPVPSLQDATEFIGATRFAYASSLDLSNSFFQIEIDENSRKYTGFSTGTMGGHHELTRLGIGLK